MQPKHVSPSLRETAFNCPHCGALTTQYWYSLYGDQQSSKTPLPHAVLPQDDISYPHIQNDVHREAAKNYAKKMLLGLPYQSELETGHYCGTALTNVFMSECYNCSKIAFWIYNKIVYPHRGEGPDPHPDLPEEIKADYEEARLILNLSPRGSAALSRLCVQKLCKYFGEPGENINQDIKSLVTKGLDNGTEQALDVVRVIGAEAVHPLTLDLKDDTGTSEMLLKLINRIVEKMISEPKELADIYSTLPPDKLKGIEDRDRKKD